MFLTRIDFLIVRFPYFGVKLYQIWAFFVFINNVTLASSQEVLFPGLGSFK